MKILKNNRFSFSLVVLAILPLALFVFACNGKGSLPPPTNDKTIDCNFSVIGEMAGTLTAQVNGGTATDKSPIKVKKGDVITFKATPNQGWQVEKWQGVDSNTDQATLTIANVDSPINVSVKFKQTKTTYTVNYTVDPKSSGIIIAKYEDGTLIQKSPVEVEKNKVIIFEASPELNYEFTRWEGATPIEGEPTKAKITVTENKTIKAYFQSLTAKEFEVKFTVTNSEGGTLEAKEKGKTDLLNSPITLKYGTTVVFTAKPKTGYAVQKWEGIVVNPSNAVEKEVFISKALDIKVTFEQSTAPAKNFEEMIDVPVPSSGIVGQDEGTHLPTKYDGTVMEYMKGVFVSGRTVHLSPYKIGKYEVAYKLWKQVVDWAKVHDYSFANDGEHGGLEETPVVGITWRDAIIWCNAYTQMKNNSEEHCVYRKSEQDSTVLKNATRDECDDCFADLTKKGFRLPTEAEWEFAARYQGDGSKPEHKENAHEYGTGVWLTKLDNASGGKKPIGFKGVHYNGAEIQPDAEQTWKELKDELFAVAVLNVWFNGKTRIIDPDAPKKVIACGEKRANALGIYDMSGNAYEWCYDWYSDDLLQGSADVTNPIGATVKDDGKVFRGGSVSSFGSNDALVGSRVSTPEYANATSMPPGLGFRVVCTK